MLDDLKTAAAAEEATGFDPSGSSALQDDTDTGTQGASERAQSWNGDVTSRSEETELTSTSHSMSLRALDPAYWSSEAEGEEGLHTTQYVMGLEELDVASKEAVLQEMFPTVKKFRLSHVLKRSGHNFGRTVEELLNQVFFEEEQSANGEERILMKGIDGFLEEETVGRRGRLGKEKKKKKHLRSGRRASSTPAPCTDENQEEGVGTWETARKDVEFICQRTGIPMQIVSSQYHKHGASLPATIRAIVEVTISDGLPTIPDDPIIQRHANELGQEFPTIPLPHLTAITRLSHPSTASAHELAKALSTKLNRSNPSVGGIEIIPKYSPIDLTHTTSPPAAKRSPAQTLNLNLTTATALAGANNLARQTAFTQASAAYRKSKSDPLMGAVAGYYSSVGRDHDAMAKKYSSAAADALVDAQSSRTELDLHGVSVKDAVRIARERVTAWWVALGDAKLIGPPGGRGFRIVTGMGRHSEGGRGKLGPAVGKMLVREGWRVEIGEGVLVVRGVAGRR